MVAGRGLDSAAMVAKGRAMKPYFQDQWTTLYNGDCREVMKTLADCSVDAVVTDPPAGISFMGKAWDHNKGGRNAWVAWLTEVMRECLRVLKPGGHALVWALPRTSHWTGWAIESAGFEVRDRVSHLFGTGFPKSLDVSKAIDAAVPRIGMFDGFALHFAEARKRSGLSQKDIARYFPSKSGRLTGCVWNWENAANVPTSEQWKVLQPMLGLSDEWLPLIERVEAEREVIGTDRNWGNAGSVPLTGYREFDLTVSATADAKQWNGWGTALKPACEDWWLCRKPLAGTIAENVLQHGTGGLNIDATRIAAEPWQRTDRTLSSGLGNEAFVSATTYEKRIDQLRENNLGRWPANVITDGSDEVLAGFPDSNGQQGDLSGHSKDRLSKGIFGDMKAGRDAVARLDSGSAARFFKSCGYSEVEELFHRAKAIIQAWDPDLASTADNLSSLSGENAVSVLKRAVIAGSQGVKLLSDSTGLSTTVTPLELKRLGEALITAILSIERSVSPALPQEGPIDNRCLVRIAATQKQTDTTAITISHWRSNGSADPVTLTLTSLNSEVGAKDSNANRLIYCAKASQQDRNEGLENLPTQSAGAVTDRKDGSAGLNSPRAGAGRTSGSRNFHATVKPTALMRYLCRLITPPNGLILDPFAGSGSTGKAAAIEGFRTILIEVDPGYCELAKHRVQEPPSLFNPPPREPEREPESAMEQTTLFAGVSA